jgi:hypothetical protein
VTNEQKIDEVIEFVETLGANDILAVYKRVIDVYMKRTTEMDDIPHSNS